MGTARFSRAMEANMINAIIQLPTAAQPESETGLDMERDNCGLCIGLKWGVPLSCCLWVAIIFSVMAAI